MCAADAVDAVDAADAGESVVKSVPKLCYLCKPSQRTLHQKEPAIDRWLTEWEKEINPPRHPCFHALDYSKM